jgi:hypothetical protein
MKKIRRATNSQSFPSCPRLTPFPNPSDAKVACSVRCLSPSPPKSEIEESFLFGAEGRGKYLRTFLSGLGRSISRRGGFWGQSGRGMGVV